MFYFSVYRNYTKTKKPRQANDGVLSAKEKFCIVLFLNRTKDLFKINKGGDRYAKEKTENGKRKEKQH